MALTWIVMVLIPKGRGEYIGIVLVEVIWKIYASIINNRLRTDITLYNTLRNFIEGRGTRTETM